jgi:hypothetical protein
MGNCGADRVKLHFEIRRQGEPGRSGEISAAALKKVLQADFLG